MKDNAINIYHVCTLGLLRDLWFMDDEDYILGMNSVPICAMSAGVTIYCFCLMSNHVHFIMKGREADCIRFIREYKRQRSRQMAFKYEGRHSIDGSDISVGLLDNPEYLQSAIAYVMKNPTAAGMRIMPTSYRWSSSNLYFAEDAFKGKEFRRLGELSMICKRRMFRTKRLLPDEYLIGNDGVIFPGCYVDYRAVESIFLSPKRLMFFLSSNRDLEVEFESGILAKACYTDTELIASMDNISREKFRGRKYESLKIEDRFLLARELRKRYGVGPKQLARVTSLDIKSIKRLL